MTAASISLQTFGGMTSVAIARQLPPYSEQETGRTYRHCFHRAEPAEIYILSVLDADLRDVLAHFDTAMGSRPVASVDMIYTVSVWLLPVIKAWLDAYVK
jgi:hypothetical protein